MEGSFAFPSETKPSRSPPQTVMLTLHRNTPFNICKIFDPAAKRIPPYALRQLLQCMIYISCEHNGAPPFPSVDAPLQGRDDMTSPCNTTPQQGAVLEEIEYA